MTGHSHHQQPEIERHCDVAVVGGSAAGLAAALQLCRQRRSVIVIDSGEPRNRPAAHMHGFLGRDGEPPSDLIAAGSEEVRSYGGELLHGRVEVVERIDGEGLRVRLTGGTTVIARRVLAATGLIDELPDIEGVAEGWGRDVVHCPFCHGYEVRDRSIVQIVTHPMGLHPASLFHRLSDRLTVVVHEPHGVDEEALDVLRAGGVVVVAERVARLIRGSGRVLEAVELADGSRIACDAVAVGPRFRVRAEPFSALGARTVPHPSGLGEVLEADPSGATSVAGLYAAGNVADPSQQVLQAAADGSWKGAMISFDLAAEDLGSASRRSANASDWDHRYGDEHIWSGNPNGTLVHEVGGLAVGRALDVGAGEGGDAVWLAEQGWRVTASDISQTALDRVAAEAERRGLDVECLMADANSRSPFEPGAFDMVSAQYASIPRTPDHRAVHNLLTAVAPGGTLLVVGHDLEPLRTPTHGTRPFDPDAYVVVDHFAEVLTGLRGWDVEVHEKRPRPPGHSAASHHVDDVVLRARRR